MVGPEGSGRHGSCHPASEGQGDHLPGSLKQAPSFSGCGPSSSLLFPSAQLQTHRLFNDSTPPPPRGPPGVEAGEELGLHLPPPPQGSRSSFSSLRAPKPWSFPRGGKGGSKPHPLAPDPLRN